MASKFGIIIGLQGITSNIVEGYAKETKTFR
jgi:hypothetical protein